MLYFLERTDFESPHFVLRTIRTGIYVFCLCGRTRLFLLNFYRFLLPRSPAVYLFVSEPQFLSVRDLLYRVDNRSVAIDNVCNDSVAESGLFRHAARAFRQGFELVYVNKFYACLTQSVMQFRVFRVHGNALLSDKHVYRAARTVRDRI